MGDCGRMSTETMGLTNFKANHELLPSLHKIVVLLLTSQLSGQIVAQVDSTGYHLVTEADRMVQRTSYDSAQAHLDQALTLFTNANDTAGLSRYYLILGDLFYMQDDLKPAFDNYFTCIEMTRRSNRHDLLLDHYFKIGGRYYYKANLAKAAEYFQECMRYGDEERDAYPMSRANMFLGNIHLDIDKPEISQEYYYRALAIRKQHMSLKSVAPVHNNLGLAFEGLDDSIKCLAHHDTAMSIRREVQDMLGVAQSKNNMATFHLNRGRYDLALEGYREAYALRIDYNAPASGHSESMINIGKAYEGLGDKQQALKYYLMGYKKGFANGNLTIIKRSTDKLRSLYSDLGDYKQALEMERLYHKTNDSMAGSEAREELQKLVLEYEFENRQRADSITRAQEAIQQDLIDQQKAAKQTFIRNILIGSMAVVLLIAFLVFRAYRAKRKANEIISNQYDVLEMQKQEITDSINYARRIQNAILPPAVLMQQLLPEHFVLYLPKDIVSGDFYWVESVGDHVFFAAVDCTGHGVPGAFVSIVGHNALNRCINEFSLTQPAAILDKLNELVRSDFQKGEKINDGMDISLAAMNKSTIQLQWAGANNPIYHVRNGELTETKGDKMPIGSYASENKFTNHEIEFQKGDVIYLFTDGFADQFGGPKGKKFKSRPFKELLISIHQENMIDQQDRLHASFDAWRGELEQLDDVCVLGVKF